MRLALRSRRWLPSELWLRLHCFQTRPRSSRLEVCRSASLCQSGRTHPSSERGRVTTAWSGRMRTPALEGLMVGFALVGTDGWPRPRDRGLGGWPRPRDRGLGGWPRPGCWPKPGDWGRPKPRGQRRPKPRSFFLKLLVGFIYFCVSMHALDSGAARDAQG